jgi:hypothetical protein
MKMTINADLPYDHKAILYEDRDLPGHLPTISLWEAEKRGIIARENAEDSPDNLIATYWG